jgi:xylulokinase
VNADYVLASDLGSGGCKTILWRREGGVVAAARREYATHYPMPGWVEQAPDDWYEAFCLTTREVLRNSGIAPGQIAGVGIVGVTHNTVLLGADDRPLRPSILLFDTRSVPQVQEILHRWSETHTRARTLNDVTPVWSWPQLLWLRQHAPEVWAATHKLLFQKDYVRHRLAASHCTDSIDAGGSLLYDPLRQDWIDAYCADLGIEHGWLPRVVAPTQIVAHVGAQGAADSGLLVGTPVITGTTDTVAEVLGAGAARPGVAVIKLASVGRIAVVADGPLVEPHILNYRHVLPGLWYPGTASKYAASAFRWLRDVLWPDLPEAAAYRLMDEAAAAVPPGAEGVLFHPHLMGEWAPYWDEKMRGDFLGLTIRHRRAHLTRAVLEGVAFALRDALAEMEGLGLAAHEIRLIGQGARSPLWSQIVADVLNRPLAVPEQPDAAFGAALITAMGVGLVEATPTAVEAAVRIARRLVPMPAAAADYEALFAIYRDADSALRGISARLHAFESRHLPPLSPAAAPNLNHNLPMPSESAYQESER